MYTSMFRKAMLGDTVTLNLDFTTGVLDSRLTFTRSTTATYINSSGDVTSAAINDPRFDYSPTNIGEPRGLLVEGASTNPILYSQDFSQATWSKSNATVTAPTTAPDGTTTAYLLTSTTAGGIISQTHAATGNATSTYSIYVKQGTAAYCDLYIYDAVAGATRLNVRFTFATKGFTVTTGSNAVYQELPNGWLRISATCAALSTTNSIICYLYVGFAVAGTTYYGWGAQLEAGSSASSYIPTSASQVTRSVDGLTMTGTNFSSWFNSPEGTFVAEFQTLYSGATADSNQLLALDSSVNKRIMYFTTGSDLMGSYDGTTSLYAVGDVTGSIAKCASTYTSTARSIVSNGGTVTTGAVVAGYSTASSLGIGLTNPKMLIRKLKFYPTALSNANIQTLTAP